MARRMVTSIDAAWNQLMPEMNQIKTKKSNIRGGEVNGFAGTRAFRGWLQVHGQVVGTPPSATP